MPRPAGAQRAIELARAYQSANVNADPRVACRRALAAVPECRWSVDQLKARAFNPECRDQRPTTPAPPPAHPRTHAIRRWDANPDHEAPICGAPTREAFTARTIYRDAVTCPECLALLTAERDTIPAPPGYPATLDPELSEGLHLDDPPPSECYACTRGRCRRCEQ